MNKNRKIAAAVSCAVLTAAISAQYPQISLKADYEKVLINEVCAKNTSIASKDGKFYDFIELYNPTGNDIDISGYGLSDNAENPFKFQFPDGSILRAGSRNVVYLDSKEFKLDGEYTGSFGISTDGETISLSSPDGNIIDQISFGNLDADTSYGRRTDGADTFAVLSMSPGRENNSSQMIKKVVEAPKLHAESGFYENDFDLNISAAAGTKIYYTLDSSTPTTSSKEYTGSLSISKKHNDNNQNQQQNNNSNEWTFTDNKGNQVTAYGSDIINDSSDRTCNGGKAFSGHSIINNTDQINSALTGENKSFTFEAIVRPNSTEGNNVFLSKGDLQICLKTFYNGAGLEFFIFQDGWQSVVCDFPQNWVGNWHQIAGVYDKGKISIYIDGQLMNTTTVSNNVAQGNQPIGVGIDTETGRKFDGAISVARVYSRALSGDELLGQMSASPRISSGDSSVLVWVDYSDNNFTSRKSNEQQNTNNNNNSNGEPTTRIVRAIAVDNEGNVSEPVCGVYFMGLKGTKSYYQNMKVISIVTDSSNLYDPQNGIFTNYDNSGREWERPANLQLFDGGNYSYEQNVGIRVHGGYTRRFDQKSLSVYARSDYGASKFKYDLFSGNVISEAKEKPIKEFDSFLLRNAGNDNGSTRFRDKLNQTLVSDRNFLTQGMEPCVVFINGKFYGHMEITEKVSEDYIDSHLDVGKKNVVIIKNQQLKEGTEEDLRDFHNLWNWVKSVDFRNDNAYEELKTKVDVDCFADYMSANIYFGNKDWGGNNVCMWKSSKIDDENQYMDGRWRFSMFDTEYSANMYGHIPADSNTFNQLMEDNSFIAELFKRLIQNDRFKKKFELAFMETAGYNFSNDRVNALIDKYSSEYREVASDTVKHFYGRDNFSGEVNTVREFFSNRYTNIVNAMRSTLNLSGRNNQLTVNNSSEKGSMKVGTILTDGSFSCRYFSDYPIRLKAYPKEGYEVVGWKLSNGKTLTENPVEVTLNDSLTAEPVYKTVSNGNKEAQTTTVSSTSASNTASQNSETKKSEKIINHIYYGDLNGDKCADLTDLSFLSLYLLGSAELSAEQLIAADIDKSGKVDIADLAYFKQYICHDKDVLRNISIG